MKKPNNPPAFPVSNEATIVQGMDLRDYFAAKALQGLISNPKYFSCDKDMIKESLIFERSFKMADAMLLERKKNQDQ